MNANRRYIIFYTMFTCLVVVVGGCIFDSGGVASYDSNKFDSNVDKDLSDFDWRPEIGVDSLVGPCTTSPAPTDNVCFYDDINDAIGQSGTCDQKKFIRSRFCFSFAPCSNGICHPSNCNSCIVNPCGSTETCTALFSGATVKFCCVTRNPKNGTKTAAQACTKNEDCLSGLCTDRGNCFQPCVQPSDCPDMTCQSVKISEGMKSVSVTGCVATTPDLGPDTGPDAGPDLAQPDSGQPDKGSLGPDLAQPDSGQPDKGSPDSPNDSEQASETKTDFSLSDATNDLD